MKRLALCVLVSTGLLGCGGGDDKPGVKPALPSGSTPPTSNPSNPSNKPSTPESTKYKLLTGVYSGTANDGNIINGLIDDNLQLWFLYTDRFDNDLGFVGSDDKAKGDTGTFEVSGKNYSAETQSVTGITITGDYKTPKVVTGSIYDRPSNATTYRLSYDNTLSNKTQTLARVDGKVFKGESYATSDNEGGIAFISFSTDGKFTGNSEDCALSGKFTVSESKRYFITSVTFGNQSNCSVAGRTISGVGVIDDENDLIILGKNEEVGLYFSTK